MGLFDKVKSLANAVTGGAAKVTVTTAPIILGEPFEVNIQALAKDAPVSYSRIYIKIRGLEKIELKDRDNDGTETIRRSVDTFEMEVVAEGTGSLEANENKTLTTEVTIPSTAPAIYRGKHAEHFYQIFVGLDCPGNDPDSGWVRLNIG